MKMLVRILPILFLLSVGYATENHSYGQKNSIRFSNPEKDSRKDRKRLRKERRLNEKRRSKQLKEKGVGADKKSQRAARRASRKKDKTGSHLDRVLTDKKSVSEREKRAAYRRDRQISKSNNRRKFSMKKNRIQKKRKPPRRKH